VCSSVQQVYSTCSLCAVCVAYVQSFIGGPGSKAVDSFKSLKETS